MKPPTNPNWKYELSGCLIFFGSGLVFILGPVGYIITTSWLWLIPSIIIFIICAVCVVWGVISDILYGGSSYY